jgi:hypothetical protein
MLTNLPAYLTIVFILTVILTLYFLWKASSSKTAVIVAIVWLVVQGALSYEGFYLNSAGVPPRITLALLPPLVLIILVLITKGGKKFTRRLDLKTLHLLHIVRIPVELCLYWLSLRKALPELVTFTGNNMDIITGITVPILYFTCFKGRAVRSVNLLFGWNIIGLVMLGSIVVNGSLSVPTVFQTLAFDQPNIAVLHFPFVWWPCFIVMVLLFSHVVMIKRLMER